MQNAIELVGITKKFGKTIANDDISMRIEENKIHAIIGENGAGKSTLMSILFGIYQPDFGEIIIKGNEIKIKDPKHANNLGIGMVHQHFKLVDIYDAVDNITLGKEEKKYKILTKKSEAIEKIKKLSKIYKLEIDFKKKIKDMSVGMQQRVEILKMLYTDADILIFDEPTAVLTPDEIDGFLKLLINFKKQGKTIIMITHKLNEIKEVADTATIIRRGKVIENINVKKTNVKKMAELMVGKKLVKVLNKYSDSSKKGTVLEFANIDYIDPLNKVKKLDDVSFKINKGEIVAIAGVEGNGQTEIASIISGLFKTQKGKILLDNYDITNSTIRRRYEKGLAHIPEDRHKHGLLLDLSVAENISSQVFYRFPFAKYGIVKKGPANDLALEVITDFDVRGANGGATFARSLSGGNQQKAIVGREMKREHKLLIAVQPTRGLDLGAISFIHDSLLNEKKLDNGILLVSYELDEVLALADRVLVINAGKITGELKGKQITRQKIGELMAAKGVS